MGETTTDQGDFLADPQSPALDRAALARVGDPGRPDRLAWNTFRTLALWEPDVWVPSLLEVALGSPNPLSGREWAGTSVQAWATGLDLETTADVILDGPEALVLIEASVLPRPSVSELRAGMAKVIEVAGLGGRGVGFMLVTPDSDDVEPDLESAAAGPEMEALAGAIGWSTWVEVGRLALDLAEEADPMRAEQVHRLVSQLQARFPGLEF